MSTPNSEEMRRYFELDGSPVSPYAGDERAHCALASGSALSGTGPEVLAYLDRLQLGERVIETGECCMKGVLGTVYRSKMDGCLCVMWELPQGKMGTSMTWGTRRVSGVPNDQAD